MIDVSSMALPLHRSPLMFQCSWFAIIHHLSNKQVPWVRYSDHSVLILNTWRPSALSGELDFPWTYLYKGKLDQKVTAREIQQSIYGAIATELNSLGEFISVLRHCFIFFFFIHWFFFCLYFSDCTFYCSFELDNCCSVSL